MSDSVNEPPPGRDNRAFTIKITRDTLWLGLAVIFLVLAIALSFLPGRSQNASQANTDAAQTAVPPRITGIAVVPASATAAATALAPTSAGEVSVPAYPADNSQAYPVGSSLAYPVEPQALATSVPTLEPPTLQPTTAAPPVFAPTRESLLQPTATPTEDDLVVVQDTSASTPQSPTPIPPQPTIVPPTPRPTLPPAGGGNEGVAVAPTTPPTLTAVPVTVLRGDQRWTPANGPIILTQDHVVAQGARLIIDAGTEVRFAPGVALYVEGELLGLGQPGRPIRLQRNDGGRWDGLYGQPGSYIALEHAEISGAGAGGTALLSEGNALVLRQLRFFDNGGNIQVLGSRLEMLNSEIAGNDMPYGAAVEIRYESAGRVVLLDNRIGGNRQADGAPTVRIDSQSGFDATQLQLERNLLLGGPGGSLILSTNGPLEGSLVCNTLTGGPIGLSLRSQTDQVRVPGFGLWIRSNVLDEHTPPIEPIYLDFGIGRAAASEIQIDMRENWWGHTSGPYEPELNPQGRGDAVGENILFSNWQVERPACAPR